MPLALLEAYTLVLGSWELTALNEAHQRLTCPGNPLSDIHRSCTCLLLCWAGEKYLSGSGVKPLPLLLESIAHYAHARFGTAVRTGHL